MLSFFVLVTGASASPQSAGGDYWGAAINTAGFGNAPWSASAQSAFSSTDAGGKGLSLLNFFSDFYNPSASSCNGFCTFSSVSGALSNVPAGTIPVLSWDSKDDGGSSDGAWANFSDQNIANASKTVNTSVYNYLTAFAASVASWGKPVFLRLDGEMNGNWNPWGTGPGNAYGNSAASFVSMWRNVYNIFSAAGATNATFVWCPNVDYYGGNESQASAPSGLTSPLSSDYPGDAYVNWTCLDGYNAGTNDGNNLWQTFGNVFGSTYATLTTPADNAGSSKPMMIGETATTEIGAPTGSGKAAWLSNMLQTLPYAFPQVRAFAYFDAGGCASGGSGSSNTDWPIECSPVDGAASSYESAFANGIKSPFYVAAATPPSGPISPPSAASSPAVAADAKGDQWVFSVSSGQTIDERYWNGSSWTETTFGGEPVMAGTSPSVVYGGSGTPVVFYTGSNGYVWMFSYGGQYWNNNEMYSWSTVQPGSSPTAVAAQNNGNVWVFWPSSSGQVDESVETSPSSGTWTIASRSLGGEAVQPYTSLSVNEVNGLEPAVDYVGVDGTLYSFSGSGSTLTNYHPGASWPAVAQGTSPVSVTDPTSYDDWIYWITTNGTLEQVEWNGSSWGTPTQMGTELADPATSLGVFPDTGVAPTVVFAGLSGSASTYSASGSSFLNSQFNWEPTAQGSSYASVTASANYTYWLGQDGNLYQAKANGSSWTVQSLGAS